MRQDFSDPQQAFECIAGPAKLNKPRENWIILYHGRPIALKTNGKFRWSKPQHALSALTNAWEHVNMYSGQKEPWETSRVNLLKFKEWRKKNIQIVRQEEYERENS